METIGAKILRIRKSKGYTQEQLSELSNINLRTLQRIEKGSSEPRGNTLNNLCDALGVNMEELLDYGKTENPNFIKYFHLSVISCLVFPIGNIILPLILWITKKDKIVGLHEQGLNLLNFQILWSILLYTSLIVWALFSIMHWPYGNFLLCVMVLLYLVNTIYPIIVSKQIDKGVMKNFYFNIFQFIKK